MAQRHAYSQPIETYSLAPHNRNIWPSPTPTANQYKHMAQRRIIETYGHTIAGRRRRRHAWPILLFALVPPVYPLLPPHDREIEVSLQELVNTMDMHCSLPLLRHKDVSLQSCSNKRPIGQMMTSCVDRGGWVGKLQ